MSTYDSIKNAVGMVPVVGGVIKGIMGMFGKSAAQQQEENQRRQIEGSKELLEAQRQKEMQMWRDTNYGAQVDELNKAGLNPALLYGKGGGGGVTVGGGGGMPTGMVAESDAATNNTRMQTAMGLANLELIKAQTRKTEAEATKTEGVDTRKGTAEAEGTEWTNMMNRVTEHWTKDNARFENIMKGVEAERSNLDWEMEKAVGMPSGSAEDTNSPKARALKASYDKAVTDLTNAKKDGRIKDAERTIKEFEADMAKSGLSPKSPWWVKFGANLLDEAGLNPFTKK